MNRLYTLYNMYARAEAVSCEPMASGGGDRRYYRLADGDGNTAIGVIGSNVHENKAFVYLAKEFAARGLPVPRVLAEDASGLCYLQEDLGHRSLYDALRRGREAGGHYGEEEQGLLRRTIALLPSLQVLGGSGLDFSQCYPQSEMDKTGVLFDLNYFKYCFLKPSGTDFHEPRLEEEFQAMAGHLTADTGAHFMYRDFQARNVMLDDEGNPRFIDFQGGRRGPLQYDVASFLWQASARYPAELREELLATYLNALRQYTDVDEAHFRLRLRLFVLFRLLQVLGAYGFRGYFERKQYFIDSIPPALHNLRELLAAGGCPYPHLAEALTRLVDSPKFATPGATERTGKPSSLRVRMFSFSYKNGIPADLSGNGGGYVFDCRAVRNPGKYERYKHLTGLDEPVIRFLEDDGEITSFLQHACQLADMHVERYIERGFTDLMFSFGCTGGQHRSVYSAQRLAEHIHRKFGVEVRLFHREQNVHTVFKPAPQAPRGRKAMVFAAGLGTRLRPLTDTMPKALVPVGGRPMLEIVVERLRESGFTDIVINMHHFADMVEAWASGREGITLSDERHELLDTGGGIRHAIPLLRNTDRFLIHNVDILSNADLPAFWAAGEDADATLLVSDRKTSRYLLFDGDMRLAGWLNEATGEVRSPYGSLDPSQYRKLAFAGIHQMKTSLLADMLPWPSRFGIVDFYLRTCRTRVIRGYIQPGLRIMDIGKPDALAEASRLLLCDGLDKR